ncbi:MAG: STAS domain-containing protein [Acutalibacteraceae bacterium]|nr:STAS domain-containing protein [Acutalibacteraceae bacterium]
MKITMNRKDNELIVALQGRLDSLSALDLDKKLDSELDGIEKLIFDFEKLEYISSAGLRILLSVYSTMESRGKMIVRNINQNVKSVFEITGFLAFINIE